MNRRRPWYATILVIFGCVLATVGALAVVAAAFALSFDAIESVGVASGVNPEIAWMLPVAIDGAMLVATITAILLRYLRQPIWYPWLVVVAGVAISVACNAAHAGLAGGVLRLDPQAAQAVSAIPAVTLFLSVHLLITLALAVLRDPAPAAAVTQTEEITADTGPEQAEAPQAAITAPTTAPTVAPADAPTSEITPGQGVRQDERTKQEVEQVVRALREANPGMSQRKIAAAALTSPATVRRILAADVDAPTSGPPITETASPELVAVGQE